MDIIVSKIKYVLIVFITFILMLIFSGNSVVAVEESNFQLNENSIIQSENQNQINDNNYDLSSDNINSSIDNDIQNQDELTNYSTEKNGLYYEDGIWYYYVNNEVDYSFEGIVEYNGGFFYVNYGTVDFTRVGVEEYQGVNYFVKKGVIDFNFTGAIYDGNSGEYYYITNGRVDTNYIGAASLRTDYGNNETYDYVYFKDGKKYDYDGLAYCKEKDILVYIRDGMNEYYSGVVEYEGKYYYVDMGFADLTYNGVTYFEETQVLIKNGIVDFSYTGVYENEGEYLYFKNGYFDSSFNGLIFYNNEWLNFEDGYLNYNTELEYYNGEYYYVTNGRVDFNYSGMFSDYVPSDEDPSVYEEKIYAISSGVWNKYYTGLMFDESSEYLYFANGIQDRDYCGLTYYNGGWFYAEDGYYQSYYSGLVEYENNYYYVSNGTIEWNYTGIQEYWDGSTYQTFYVINGSVNLYYNGTYTYNSFDGYWSIYDIVNGKVSNYTGVKTINNVPYLFVNGYINKGSLYIGYYNNDFYSFYEGQLANWIKGGLLYIDNQNINTDYYYVENGKINWSFNGFAPCYEEYYDANSYYYSDAYFVSGRRFNEYSGLEFVDGKWYYMNDGTIVDWYNGLVLHTDNNYYYVENGEINWNYYGGAYMPTYDQGHYYETIVYWAKDHIDPTYSGYANFDYGSFVLFENGNIKTDYDGLYFVNDQWYFFEDGIASPTNQVIVLYNGGYFYVNGLNVDWSFNGYIDGYLYIGNDYSIYGGAYIKNGVVDNSVNGLYYVDYFDEWIYLVNGLNQGDYTDLVYYNGGWFYVYDNYVDWNYTGVVLYNGGLFYVDNGVVDWSHTGVETFEGYYNENGDYVDVYKKVYIENGTLNNQYTGLVYEGYDNSWIYVTQGYYDDTVIDTLAYYNGGWFYVDYGNVGWYHDGMVEYNGGWFYVSDGVVDFNYNGEYGFYFPDIGYKTIKVSGGVLDTQFTGAYNDYYFINGIVSEEMYNFYESNGTIYLYNYGTLNKEFCGTLEYNGKYYCFKDGCLDSGFTGVSDDKYFINGVEQVNYTGTVVWQRIDGNISYDYIYVFDNGQIIDLTIQ